MKYRIPTPANGGKTNSVCENAAHYPLKLAVVDDDHNELLLMTRAVNQSPYLEMVGSYSSGEDALRGIPASSNEVVLTDFRMPGMSGIELAKRLKDVRPALFIILISGWDSPNTDPQARKAGADAYLTKPFSLGRFLEALTDCLRRRKHGSAIRGQRGSAERMSTEESAVRKELLRIVAALEDNFHTREDLLQEALVYFWSKAQQCPGRALSWHLQGVKFHLQNLRKSGRSLDSSKRRKAQVSIPDPCDDWDNWRDSLEFEQSFLSAVAARDFVSLLEDRLMARDRLILSELAEGQGVRDIAGHLKTSHQSVLRSRERIAALALALGVVSPTSSNFGGFDAQ